MQASRGEKQRFAWLEAHQPQQEHGKQTWIGAVHVPQTQHPIRKP
jgi:hypothetical protein